MSYFCSAVKWENAWRIRTFALGLIVLVLGLGSQIAVNTLTAGAQMLKVNVSAHVNHSITLIKVNDASLCSVATSQFAIGSVLALYNSDGTFNRRCIAVDKEHGAKNGQISLVFSDLKSVANWHTHQMYVQVVNNGKNSPYTSLVTNFQNQERHLICNAKHPSPSLKKCASSNSISSTSNCTCKQ